MRGTQNKKIVVSCWRLIWRSFRLRDKLRHKGTTPHVLMFHQVREKEEDCAPGDFSVSVSRFEEILDWHVRHGYRFAAVDEITSTGGEQSICYITFDDGFADVLLAMPALHERRAPFCIYVITEVELSNSKAALERLLPGKKIKHFAFPYGTILACSVFDRKYVKEAGYATAMTTDQIPVPRKIRAPYGIPRFDASRKDILEVI